jgi:folate-dependent phosphoribosylglycinamide formyltransferase PurN
MSEIPVARFCITTHLPPGGLYFIDRAAAGGGLELVVVQGANPPAAGLRSLPGRLKDPLRRLRSMGDPEAAILRRELPGFLPAHRADGARFCRLEALARRHGFETYYAPKLNLDGPARERLRDSGARFMFVLGGKILKPKTLAAFGGCWINGHGGILPDYRGLFSEYWALVGGEPDKVGCTVHLLTETVDQGSTLRESRIEVRRGETLGQLIVRNHANLVRTYLETIRDLVERGRSIESLARPVSAAHGDAYFSVPKDRDRAALLGTPVEDLCPAL